MGTTAITEYLKQNDLTVSTTIKTLEMGAKQRHKDREMKTFLNNCIEVLRQHRAAILESIEHGKIKQS